MQIDVSPGHLQQTHAVIDETAGRMSASLRLLHQACHAIVIFLLASRNVAPRYQCQALQNSCMCRKRMQPSHSQPQMQLTAHGN